MAIFEKLTPAERARQLGNPEGEVGIAVADWLNETNKAANAKTVALLGVIAGDHVLEIGFGNGRTVPDVIGQAADVRYTGIDISPTMVAEASRFNAALVAAGKASFHLSSAEHMPFNDRTFDRVFSIGVIHFCAEPDASLVEVHRVMRSGGLWSWAVSRQRIRRISPSRNMAFISATPLRGTPCVAAPASSRSTWRRFSSSRLRRMALPSGIPSVWPHVPDPLKWSWCHGGAFFLTYGPSTPAAGAALFFCCCE